MAGDSTGTLSGFQPRLVINSFDLSPVGAADLAMMGPDARSTPPITYSPAVDSGTLAAVIGATATFFAAFVTGAYAVGSREARLRNQILQELELLRHVELPSAGHRELKRLIDGHLAQYIQRNTPEPRELRTKRRWRSAAWLLLSCAPLLIALVVAGALSLFAPLLSNLVWSVAVLVTTILLGYTAGGLIVDVARSTRSARSNNRRAFALSWLEALSEKTPPDNH